MYPYDLFLGMDLYDLMMAFGFFAALVYFRIFADRARFGATLQNSVIIAALCAVLGGYGSAVLFQAFYNYLDSGVFEIAKNTGATFYGGLIGGALVFLAVYFGAGHFVCKKQRPAAHFWHLSEIAAGSIAVAHGFGRLGCLFAGCCHGKVTDAWYGIYNAFLGQRTVPVQLFEALFLFVLAAVLTVLLIKGIRGNLGVYLSVYAVWRFFAEYLRTDDRGQSLLPFLSPSQFTAVCLFLIGIAVWWVARRQRNAEKVEENEHDPA